MKPKKPSNNIHAQFMTELVHSRADYICGLICSPEQLKQEVRNSILECMVEAVRVQAVELDNRLSDLGTKREKEMASIPGMTIFHGQITPSMREGKLNMSAFNQVNERLFKDYWERATFLNPDATFHMILTMEDPKFENPKE